MEPELDKLKALCERQRQLILDIEYDYLNSENERLAEYNGERLERAESELERYVKMYHTAKVEAEVAVEVQRANPHWGIF